MVSAPIRIALAIGCALALAQCWRAPLRGTDFGPESDPYRHQDYVEPEELEHEPVYRVVLVGDAGSASPNDPTLALLGKWANADPKRTAVLYLGDNLYPAGLEEGDRPRGERVLNLQIDATSARKIFLPGNHDWGYTATQRIGPGVLANQQKFIEAHAKRGAEFEPKEGCPGPVSLELMPPSRRLAGGVTVIVLDLYWWLLPEPMRPVCDGIASTDEFIAKLRTELEAHRGRNVVVAAHHPIRSAGPHGGFTRGFWYDLGVAIYYRFYTVQDLVEPDYLEMVRVLGEVLQESPPLAMVGGHDHSLQILDGNGEARLVIVSGSASNTSGVTSTEDTLFAHAHLGFIALDFYEAEDSTDGVALVNVVETGRGDDPVFSLALNLAREEAPPEQIPTREVPAKP
jgi:Calcineurin-like phosphoesterase